MDESKENYNKTLLQIPQSVTVETNFGPIASQLTSPGMNDISFLAMQSPLNNSVNFPYSLSSPLAMSMINHNFDLPLIPPISSIYDHNQSINWQNMMNFNTILPAQASQIQIGEIPPDLKVFETETFAKQTNRNQKNRGTKRKIKTEQVDIYDEPSFIVNDNKRKKRRGRKLKTERDSLQHLLSENRKTKHDGFVGIKNIYGEVKVAIPPKIDSSIQYEVFGFACTEKIEDILQPKKRTRYVRGLNENEKKDRRREQNRNAAARSRARKNAMISKVIQLHQENLALRAHVSATIREIKLLNDEKNKLQ